MGSLPPLRKGLLRLKNMGTKRPLLFLLRHGRRQPPPPPPLPFPFPQKQKLRLSLSEIPRLLHLPLLFPRLSHPPDPVCRRWCFSKEPSHSGATWGEDGSGAGGGLQRAHGEDGRRPLHFLLPSSLQVSEALHPITPGAFLRSRWSPAALPCPLHRLATCWSPGTLNI